jgi:hypothetical protein
LGLHSLGSLHYGLLGIPASYFGFSFLGNLIQLSLGLSLNSIREKIRKFLKQVWMLSE